MATSPSNRFNGEHISVSVLRAQRRQKLKTKRKIIIAIWSVAFAYVSLTATTVDLASAQVGDAADVYPNSQVISNSVFQASQRPLLRATGEDGSTVTDDFTSTLSGEPSTSSTLSESVVTSEGFTTTAADSYLTVGRNCTPPAIDDFPRDLFTPEQRRQGFVAIHFVASVYIFYCIAIVCDNWFVPCIECICDEFHLPSDIAGASVMAVATSAPELFTNVIGTFVTKGDLGPGTIIGSAVFNILGVCACCGLAVKTALPLEWYPITRDCLFYSFSVILLIVVLLNGQVHWYEALVFVIGYAIYIFVMYKNSSLKRWAENLVAKFTGGDNDEPAKKRESVSGKRRASFVAELTSSTERTPLLGAGRDLESEPPQKGWLGESGDRDGDIPAEVMDEMLISNALHKSRVEADEEEAEWSLSRPPIEDGIFACVFWLITWPPRFVFAFTVPDCREEKLRKLYPITFIMCIVWIAGLSYLASWTITIIGHTLSIPDSIMGLTFLAAGTSVPEVVSSVIVARQGLGTMGISNSIGSNTFDILVCLGLPWLIRGSMIATEPVNYIQINSAGLEYSAMSLLVSLVLLYSLLAWNRFYLDRKVGIIALLIYAVFLILASLFEMNVFFTVNLPTCETDY